MTSTANGRVVPGQLESFGVPPFDGYPYLVTRIGHSALRHVALLPADWSRERLVDRARRQRDANRLDTCAVLGRHDAVSLTMVDAYAYVQRDVHVKVDGLSRCRRGRSHCLEP